MTRGRCDGDVVTVRAQPGRCHHESVLKQGIMGMCHRESSAKALQARICVRAGEVRRLSQSLASVRQVQCAGVAPGILLEAAEYSYLFLAQPPLDGGRSKVVRAPHPEVQDQPERCGGRCTQVLAERLSRNFANSGKICMHHAMVASTRVTMSVCRR